MVMLLQSIGSQHNAISSCSGCCCNMTLHRFIFAYGVCHTRTLAVVHGGSVCNTLIPASPRRCSWLCCVVQGGVSHLDWRRACSLLLELHLSTPGLQLRLLSKQDEVASHIINTARVREPTCQHTLDSMTSDCWVTLHVAFYQLDPVPRCLRMRGEISTDCTISSSCTLAFVLNYVVAVAFAASVVNRLDIAAAGDWPSAILS